MTQRRRTTVLIADDDPAILGLLSEIVETEGWEAVLAGDGAHALAAARSRTPDLAILDIMMPERTGIEVLRALRAEPATRNTPVLCLSARRDDATIFEAMSAGSDGYLTKPFDPGQLAVLLRRLTA